MKKLLDKLSCPYKAYLNSLGLTGEKEKTYEIAKLIKTTFIDNEIKDLVKPGVVRKIVEDWAVENEEVFSMEKEKNSTVELLIERLESVANDFNSMGVKIIDKNINVKTKIGVEEVFHKFDLALEFPNDNNLYLCNFYQTHNNATVGIASSISAGIEWELKEKLGKLAFPNKDIVPVAILLTADKKNSSPVFSKYFIKFDDSKKRSIDMVTQNKIDVKIKELTSSFTNKQASRCGDIYKDCSMCPCKNLCEYYEANLDNIDVVKVSKKGNNFTNLTPAQENVADVDGGIYRVQAGAGTGKTTTLVNRIVSLIQKGCEVDDILVITFGEKSVQEIKDKLDFWLQEWFITEVTSKDFNIFTFNGYGSKIIEENYADFGYTAVPTLIDKVQKLDIIKTLLDLYPEIEGLNYMDPLANYFGNKSGALLKVEEYIDKFLANEHDPIRARELENKMQKEFPTDYKTLTSIIDEFTKYLKKNNLITYEIQIHALVTVCTQQYQHILSKYARKEIIVDEFQDTNTAQLQFIKTLTMQPVFNTLVMCGDDSQSIYAWRGADKSIMLNLERDFSNLQDVQMTENFRSTKQIVELANKFNELDDTVLAKNLTSVIDGAPVQLIDATPTGTFQSVLDTVKSYISKGRKYHEIGIIAKTHYELEQIYQLLQENDIPAFISAHECFKDNPKVKNLSDFTKYLKDTEKTLYLAEFLQVKDFKEYSRQASVEKYVGVESEKIKNEIAGMDDKDLLEYFMKNLEELSKNDRILSELYILLSNKKFTNVIELGDYLTKLRMYDSDIGVEKDETAYDAITIMTAHAAKGREFPVIIGVLDKFTNSSNDAHQCVFVMITRAMEELVLIQDKSKTTSRAIYYDTIKDLL